MSVMQMFLCQQTQATRGRCLCSFLQVVQTRHFDFEYMSIDPVNSRTSYYNHGLFGFVFFFLELKSVLSVFI